jgi:hypothetical protein
MRKNIGCGCLKTGRWRKFLDLTGRTQQQARGNCIMRRIIICIPQTVRMTKSKRMRYAGHVVRMEEKRNAYSL